MSDSVPWVIGGALALSTALYLGLRKSAPKVRKSALLIIDMQNDFLTGSLVVDRGVEAIPVIEKLRQDVKFDMVAHTQDWHPEGHVSFYPTHSHKEGAMLFKPFKLPNGQMQVLWPIHCIQHSDGAKFHPKLTVLPTDQVVQKGCSLHVDSYSGFFDNDQKTQTDLAARLTKAGITDVYCCGVAYDFCVGSSAIDAARLGFKCYLVDDATYGVDPAGIVNMKKRLADVGVTILKSSEVVANIKAQQAATTAAKSSKAH